MSNPERRIIRSIPPSIRNGAQGVGLRLPLRIRIGGGSLGNIRRVPQEQPEAREQDWSQVVTRQHVFHKPPRQERTESEPLHERIGKVEWTAEVVEDYNNRGDLGIILEFYGIELTDAPFLKGRRYYGPDTTLFYSPISYRKKRALLLLATTGDIFESQVVPVQKDLNPFFQEELYISPLATTYNARSMAVQQNNGLVIVSYNPRVI